MKYLIDLTMLYEVDTGMIMINGEEESSIKLSNGRVVCFMNLSSIMVKLSTETT